MSDPSRAGTGRNYSGHREGNRRAPLRALASATAMAALLVAGCGADEGPRAGDPVLGRAPGGDAAADRPVGSAPSPDGSGQGSDSGATGSTDGGSEGPADDAESPPEPGPLDAVRVDLEQVGHFEAPTKLVARPDSDLLYLAEQAGVVRTFDPSSDDAPEVALDLREATADGGERGLLGLAFSPDGSVLYAHHSGLDGETVIAAFAMDGDAADPDSRRDLLTVPQPYPNHNGGDIVVDSDGLLWIALGDGGAADDPERRAQDPDDLLGKILRIDPVATGDQPYGIPADNPFAADGAGRAEIAVVGVRNPWRIRFDSTNGDLWVADVGQDGLEEIDRLPSDEILGANLGWSRYEGSSEVHPDHDLADGPIIGPVFEMSHSDGWCSITGGLVYRGTEIPDLVGAYLFGDLCQDGLSAIRLQDGAVTETVVLDDDVSETVSIDADGQGEIYVLTNAGPVYRLIAGS